MKTTLEVEIENLIRSVSEREEGLRQSSKQYYGNLSSSECKIHIEKVEAIRLMLSRGGNVSEFSPRFVANLYIAITEYEHYEQR